MASGIAEEFVELGLGVVERGHKIPLHRQGIPGPHLLVVLHALLLGVELFDKALHQGLQAGAFVFGKLRVASQTFQTGRPKLRHRLFVPELFGQLGELLTLKGLKVRFGSMPSDAGVPFEALGPRFGPGLPHGDQGGFGKLSRRRFLLRRGTALCSFRSNEGRRHLRSGLHHRLGTPMKQHGQPSAGHSRNKSHRNRRTQTHHYLRGATRPPGCVFPRNPSGLRDCNRLARTNRRTQGATREQSQTKRRS